MFPRRLFPAKGGDRIHTDRVAGGEGAGGGDRRDQQGENSGERRRIERADTADYTS